MKVAIAIDSFKGSLSSIEVAESIKEGIYFVYPKADVLIIPLADGGEGTVEAMTLGDESKLIKVKGVNSYKKPLDTYYGFIDNKAIIEVASTIGLPLIKNDKRPLEASSYGVGILIKDAIKRGFKEIIIGLGGSSTNDGGMGMLTALGYKFLDKNNNILADKPLKLDKICSINDDEVLPVLKDIKFIVASDVTNPLYGKNGATYIFGKQKGLNDNEISFLDEGMKNFANVSNRFTNTDYTKNPGAGAAGGLGYALMSYLNARVESGIDLVLKTIDFSNLIKDYEYVITGEGKLDRQSVMGKTPIGVSKLAKSQNKKVLVFAGSITNDYEEYNSFGIDAYFPIVRGVTSLNEALNRNNARNNIRKTVEQVFRLIKIERRGVNNLEYVKVSANDNVAIALRDLVKGTKIDDITLIDDIPQAHKLALKDIAKGEAIIRYNVILGYANKDIKKGEWINEYMLDLPTPPSLDDLEYGKNIVTNLPKPKRQTFLGYKVPNSKYAGTRNILAIHTTVQCVTGVLNIAIKKIKEELLPKYSNVDDVVAINHAYGCGVAINAREAKVPIRILHNLVYNPNFGGEIMVVGLGCEKLTVDKLLDKEYINSDNIIILQDKKGFKDMIDSIVEMADKKLAKLNLRKRVELPLSELIIGMQCGGSDAFSGVSANPSAGYASDMLVSAGATVMFSEVTEVRDGVKYIAERCLDKESCDKLASEMSWYDNYLLEGDVDRSANPTPGNKKGGLSNIVEKAMGSIAKSGHAPIVEVLSPGEMPSKKGLIYAATPASDIVCGPCQLASGITLQVFMTGRGTPYNLTASPVIKVSSRNDLKNIWDDLIDINAGEVAVGEKTIEEKGTELFDYILDVASGKIKTKAEEYGIANDFCIFNPAPIT